MVSGQVLDSFDSDYDVCNLHNVLFAPPVVAFLCCLHVLPPCLLSVVARITMPQGWWENLVRFNPLPADLSLQFKSAKWKTSLIIQQLGVALELQQTCNTKPLWSLWSLQKCLQIARGTYLGRIDTPPEHFGFVATLGLALLVAAEHPTSGNHRIFSHKWIKQ